MKQVADALKEGCATMKTSNYQGCSPPPNTTKKQNSVADLFECVETQNESQDRQNSYLVTLCEILAVSIGPTVFIIPGAFSIVGYVLAIVGIVCVGTFYTCNVHLLMQSCNVLEKRRGTTDLTFAKVVQYSFEDCPFRLNRLALYSYHLMNMLFIISWSGELSFNVVFLCGNVKNIVDFHTHGDVSIRLIMLCWLIPCVLISSIPGVKLAVLSTIATTIDIVFMGFVLLANYQSSDQSAIDRPKPVKSVSMWPNFLSTIFFTLNFTAIVLPLKNRMKNKSTFDSTFGTFTVSVVVICAINTLFGLFGYLRYGDDVHYTITTNLPQNEPFIQFMLVLYCVAVYFSYPVCFFVIFEIVWTEWLKDTLKNEIEHVYRECVARVCLNLIIFAFILTCPKLHLFTTIGGLVCAVFDSIIMPSVVQILVLCNDDITKFKVVVCRNALIILCGMVLFYFGLIQCVTDIRTLPYDA